MSKWSGTGVGGLPKEGLLHLSLQEESYWPEGHRGCLRGNSRRGGSSGAEGRGAQGVRGPDSWPSGVGQALSLSWSDPFGQLPLSSVTIC